MKKNRILEKNAIYHVSSHINSGAKFMAPDKIKNLFMEVLGEAAGKFEFRLYAFVITDNYFSFIIQPLGDANLSRIMQWFKSVFAIRYNILNKEKGLVWGARSKSIILRTDEDFIEYFNLIDAAPVKEGLARKSTEWKYCGAYHNKRRINSVIATPPPKIAKLFPNRFYESASKETLINAIEH